MPSKEALISLTSQRLCTSLCFLGPMTRFPAIMLQVHAMKPLQIMRAVLNALRQPSLFSKGTAMQRRSPTESAGSASPPSPAAFRRHHAAVFVDRSGHLNLAAHLSKTAIAEASSHFTADFNWHPNNNLSPRVCCKGPCSRD